MRRAGNAQNVLGPFGRSRARRYQPSGDRVTFADVAGIDEAKAELSRGRRLPAQPGEVPTLGGADPARRPALRPAGHGEDAARARGRGRGGRAVLLDGGVRVRRGDRRRRRRTCARPLRAGEGGAPAIVFIDELDAIGRSRTSGVAGFSGGNDEREQTLNQILTEMDGFDSSTERDRDRRDQPPDVLDQALLRPGRFDRRVAVQPPDRAGREAILKVHTRGVPLAPDVDLGRIAATTPGMVGADLANLVNEAALLAARREPRRRHRRRTSPTRSSGSCSARSGR